MSTATTADHVNAHEGTGTEASGELDDKSARTTEAEGKPGEEKASATGEPSGEGLVDGLNLKTLPKQYKDLQREYNRLQNEIVKKFDRFGGAEQVLQWTDYLSNNPDFAQWITEQKTKSSLGIDETKLDDQTKAALETVRRIARSVVDEEVSKIRQKEIAPLSEAAKQNLISSHFELMNRQYGDEWHEMRDLMSELSENLPQEMQDQPTFEDIEDLYFKALRKSNKLEAFAAGKLKKQIEEKKGKSTDKPAPTGQGTPKAAKSIAEAFAMARQSHNQ